MKLSTSFIILNLAISGLCAADQFSVINKESTGKDGPNRQRVLSLSRTGDAGAIPQLEVPVSDGIRTRICAAKTTDDRLAIVLQYDEFFLQYREYQLESGKWTQKKSVKVRSLDGKSALDLNSAEIPEFGVVKVGFSEDGMARPEKWDEAVLSRKVQSTSSEIYKLSSKQDQPQEFIIEK